MINRVARGRNNMIETRREDFLEGGAGGAVGAGGGGSCVTPFFVEDGAADAVVPLDPAREVRPYGAHFAPEHIPRVKAGELVHPLRHAPLVVLRVGVCVYGYGCGCTCMADG